MPWENDTTWVFRSTGRRVEDVVDGMVGIDGDGSLGVGHDAGFEGEDYLTSEERADLADEMIARWQRFKLGDQGATAVIDNGILWGSCAVRVPIELRPGEQRPPYVDVDFYATAHHAGSPCERCGAVKHRG